MPLYPLFIAPIFFWGFSWYVITFQLTQADPMVSTSLRFFISAGLMFAYAIIFKKDLQITRKDHFPILLQGAFLFGLNYWVFYVAQQYVTSGIAALLFSLIIFFNVFNAIIFLKKRPEKKTILFALLGMLGAVLVFRTELSKLQLNSSIGFGLGLCFLATYFASLGNTMSFYNQKSGRGVLKTNSYGMLYGSVLLFVVIIVTGKPLAIDFDVDYAWSLAYLSLGASVLAFGSYLSLLGRIGTAKAAYLFLIVPLIALSVSTVLEGYTWTFTGVCGALLILFSCFQVMYETAKKQHKGKER